MRIDSRTKHGQYKTKLYGVWAMMRYRCNNPRHPQFKYWGGKGIKVCSEWSEFLAFAAWAKANGYEEGLLLDRKNGQKNYEPENCEWVTPHKSAVNRCDTKLTQLQVDEIRRRYADGEIQKVIAFEFGVARNTISGIVNGKSWKDSFDKL